MFCKKPRAPKGTRKTGFGHRKICATVAKKSQLILHGPWSEEKIWIEWNKKEGEILMKKACPTEAQDLAI